MLLYAIKGDFLWLIESFLECQKIKDLNQEIIKLSAFKPFQDRRTDIVAYKDAIFNQKGGSLLDWTKGNLHAIKVQTQELRKGYAFRAISETNKQIMWLKEVLYAHRELHFH